MARLRRDRGIVTQRKHNKQLVSSAKQLRKEMTKEEPKLRKNCINPLVSLKQAVMKMRSLWNWNYEESLSEENIMKLYHMSQTLQLGDTLTPDYQKNIALVQPFIQALEQSTDCFYGMVLNGKYMYALLGKFRLWEWSDYAKWATEGAFEFIRKTEFPESYGRMSSNYFYDNIPSCKKLYDYDWGCESQEEQEKVHLFEVDVDDDSPQKRDMNIYDEAYDAMSASQDVHAVLDCARRYFSGAATAEPTWEILSNKAAKAVTDISSYLRSDKA